MARRKPAKPSQPFQVTDTGPKTPAQRAGATFTVPAGAPPGDLRKRRDHLLVTLSEPRTYGKTIKPALITARQCVAGLALHDAWCETQRGSGPIKEYVDHTPDFAAIALTNAERIGAYSAVSRYLPASCRDAVLQVVVTQAAFGADGYDARLAQLRAGLDAIADGLRL